MSAIWRSSPKWKCTIPSGPTRAPWEEEVQAIREWAMKRQYILFSKGYIQGMDASDPNDDLTDEEMQHYFGEAMAIQPGVSGGGKQWNDLNRPSRLGTS